MTFLGYHVIGKMAATSAVVIFTLALFAGKYNILRRILSNFTRFHLLCLVYSNCWIVLLENTLCISGGLACLGLGVKKA
jgi:hypothetical protein